MNVKEAIEWQEAFKKTYNGFPKEVETACNMAIDALKIYKNMEKYGKDILLSLLDEDSELDENSDLEILFVVNGEVIKNENDYYRVDKWNKSEIDYYFVYDNEILLLSHGIHEIFDKIFNYEDIGIPPYVPEAEVDKIIRKKVMGLPWKKAVIIYVEAEYLY